jgi:hypothetical protein
MNLDLYRPLAPIALLAVLAAGCGRETTAGNALLAPGAVAAPPTTDARFDPPFDPAGFVPAVDHPFLPLVPGTVSSFADESPGGEAITVEVLPAKKRILGVDCTVVRDRVYVDGSLVEDTFDWYAQDRAGNVWYMGEDSKEYENGVVVSTEGSWEAGVAGAEAGIIMPAEPRIGMKYAQEFAPGVAEDMASVVSLKQSVSVPYGDFTDCVQTMEFSKLAPGARGYKFYARDVGLVLEESPRGGHERTELLSVSKP